ncbi:ornithine cyclodeaminase family protein [Caldifermentibacillus hisashii]|uniref:ornithine cyclodeaminase family protein n=1 Tax=Caldifermentibacillus hisashii TaxID=996558 RepID=UPI0034D73047
MRKILFLNQSDMKKIITMKDAIDSIDEAYKLYEKKEFLMPQRMQVSNNMNTLLLMPCFINQAIGTKMVTVFPQNTPLPTLHSLVILNNPRTGEIQAIMDGSFLTGFRTGAIGGSAIRHLAAETATKLAIIGTGVQGLYQAIAACTERRMTDIYLFNRTRDKIPQFKKELQKWIGTEIRIHPVLHAEDAVKEADIIITATNSYEPVLPDKQELYKNKIVIGIGSFQKEMQEFPDALYKMAEHLFVDSEDAIKESGDIIIPLQKKLIHRDSIIHMSNYIVNKEKIILNREKSIVFKSTGMALFDIVVANFIYKKAVKKNIGIRLSFS